MFEGLRICHAEEFRFYPESRRVSTIQRIKTRERNDQICV